MSVTALEASSHLSQSIKAPGVTIPAKEALGTKGITTSRLHLRAWQDGDITAVHAIMQDPDVNHYLQRHKLNELSTIEALAGKSLKTINEKGYGYLVVQHAETKEVIGMVGLNYVELKQEPFPCHTISWILKKECWGRGYAQEAARALLKYGFEMLRLPKIFSCTTWNNTSSQRVMERLGMTHLMSFEFPGFSKDDLFCNHVLYVKEAT